MDRLTNDRKDAATDNKDDDDSRQEASIKTSLLYSSSPSSSLASISQSGTACCFAHNTPVTFESGETRAIQDLRPGDSVQTLAGPRLVVGLLRSFVESDVLCQLGSSDVDDGVVVVSAWHPVSFDGASWYFPVHLTVAPVLYTGNVYSILLEADGSPFAHTFRVAGLWCASLGHGIVPPPIDNSGSSVGGTEAVDDIRRHPFFGDYVLVCEKMAVLRPVQGAYQCYGATRDPMTGLVNGFRPAPLSVRVVEDALDGQQPHGNLTM